MSIADKLITIAQNQEKVYDAGQLSIIKDNKNLKGATSGYGISIDDISPVQHDVRVKLGSKNLFNIANVKNCTNGTVVNNGEALTVTAPGTSAFTAYGVPNTLSHYAPQLEVGKTYTINAIKEGTTAIYLRKRVDGVDVYKQTWRFSQSLPITQDALDAQVYWYGNGAGVATEISNIQIEEGETATTYTPYTEDFSGGSVTVSGKNLFNNDTDKIVKYSFKTSATGTLISYYGYIINLPKGNYVASGVANPEYISSTGIVNPENRTAWIYGAIIDKDNIRKGNALGFAAGTAFTTTSFEIPEGYSLFIYHSIKDKTKEDAQDQFTKFNIQIEAGTTTTEYEPYHDTLLFISNPTDANGITTIQNFKPMKGIPKPGISIIPNNPNLTISNVDYIKDIDKAYNELVNQIALSGGE